MLGPAVVPGNQVIDLQNGDEMFPVLLAAVSAAEKNITFPMRSASEPALGFG